MKYYKTHAKFRLFLIMVFFLFGESNVMAAKYDLHEKKDDINSISNILPLDWGMLKDEARATEINNKGDYLSILSLLKESKLKEAEVKILEQIKKTPNDPSIYNLQAILNTLENDGDSAKISYIKATHLDNENIIAFIGLARLSLDSGKLDEAKKYADKALNINDKSINTYFLLSDIAAKNNNQKEIEKYLITAFNKVSGDIHKEAIVLKNITKLYAVQKKPEKVLLLSQEILDRHPGNSIAFAMLVQAQLISNKNKLAQQTLLKLIQQEDKDVEHRLLLAKLLLEQPGMEQNVLQLLNEVTAIAPESLSVLLKKTAFLIQLKYYKDARIVADKIDQLVPKSGIGKSLYGDIFLAEKKYDQALEAFQKAYKIKRNNNILFAISDLLVRQGKQSKAIDLLNSELVKNNKNSAVHFKIANIYQSQNKYKQAEIHYKALLNEKPNNLLALNNLAWVYHLQNNPKAIILAEKAYKKSPQTIGIADTYGYILVKQGKIKEGISILEDAVALAPDINSIQYHLAEAYSVNGNTEKSIKILEYLAQKKNDFAEKVAVIKLLNKLKGM